MLGDNSKSNFAVPMPYLGAGELVSRVAEVLEWGCFEKTDELFRRQSHPLCNWQCRGFPAVSQTPLCVRSWARSALERTLQGARRAPEAGRGGRIQGKMGAAERRVSGVWGWPVVTPAAILAIQGLRAVTAPDGGRYFSTERNGPAVSRRRQARFDAFLRRIQDRAEGLVLLRHLFDVVNVAFPFPVRGFLLYKRSTLRDQSRRLSPVGDMAGHAELHAG